MDTSSQPIAKHPAGSFRELISVQFPLFVSLLSGSLMGFCDRLFLARYSLDAFEAVSYAIYICMIFQLGCMRIATSSQILIGRASGSQNKELAGRFTWQMVWFSCATMAVTLPLSQAFSTYFFSIEEVQSYGRAYFNWMMFFNFLFPLGTSLSSFFIGMGKTRIITYATLASHSVNITLNYSLIFGVGGIIPPLGASGAAIATGVSQGIYCTLLFSQFIRRKYLEFGCRYLRLKLDYLLQVLRLGIPTAAARMHNLFIWSLMMKMLAEQGEAYLLALSYGSMLVFLFSPLNESSVQSLITLFSYYFGAKRPNVCNKILLKAHIVAFANIILVTCALNLFGRELVENFSIKGIDETAFTTMMSNTAAVCFFFAVESCLYIAFALAMAQRRVLHVTLVGMGCTLLFGYGGFYLAFVVLQIPARYTWWVIAAHLAVSVPFYYVRRKATQSLGAHP